MKKRGEKRDYKTVKSFFDSRKFRNRKGQIWVETVIYTLIAFVIIGLVLAYAKPKIEELQDQAIIEQSITMLKDIDSIIGRIGAPGNQRLVEMGIKKGNLKIDGVNDIIVFEMESRSTYSEPGEKVVDGNLLITTTKVGKFNLVNITRDYSTECNLTYERKDQLKSLSKTSTSYQLLISNKGGEKVNIDISLV
jgi:hypothetical protein